MQLLKFQNRSNYKLWGSILLIILIGVFLHKLATWSGKTRKAMTIEQIAKKHESSYLEEHRFRLIILPACSSCYHDVKLLIKKPSKEGETLIIAGRKAALNILKKEQREDYSRILFYDRALIDLSEYQENKTYLFSSNGELISVEFLIDYLKLVL